MAEFAIKAAKLSKLYRLGQRENAGDGGGSGLLRTLKSPLKNLKKYRALSDFSDVDFDSDAPRADILWALRDVSFEVERGEVVGIIGTNGAGKSTLLKILSRITSPARGRVEIRGRVYSLLEVGTGFHMELTGRENVYLNGTILGMKKKEIDQRFDEIVAFSGIEKFIDTPAKRYSSGMTVRLAFAIAAHMDPEILIVDEVLAVGDSAFQKKCLSKMQDVGQQGATVLFVSHSMPSVTRLCSRGILLHAGRVVKDGSAGEVVSAYLSLCLGTSTQREWADVATAPQSDVVRMRAVRVVDDGGAIVEGANIHKPIGLQLEFDVLKPGCVLMPEIEIFDEEGVHLFSTTEVKSQWQQSRSPGRYKSTAWIPGNFLPDGTFYLDLKMVTPESHRMHVSQAQVAAFQVIDQSDGQGARGLWAGDLSGVVRPLLKWTTDFREE